jgi:prolyl-tRNA synthetase
VRPTSEAIICHMFGQWVQSYRDLPLLINQWCSVVRWENRPRAFLRTSEFLWQEGHTCHSSAEEAEARTLQMLDIYRDFVETELAIPVIAGVKSDSEKFAGAEDTYTIEAMMGGKRWALQSGTSHYMGQNFARAFGIDFLDAAGERKLAWSTSWGLSHRTIGAIVMVHGDDAGLKLPPRVAPYQAVIVPIWRKVEERGAVEEWVNRVSGELSEVRTFIDRRDDKTPGWKFNEWELRGVPLRIEIGPRDVQNQQVVVVRRDTREKRSVPIDALAPTVDGLLREIQVAMFEDAADKLRAHTAEVASLDELYERAATNAGFSLASWCGDEACETRVKDESKATIRCLPLDQPATLGRCIVCDRPGTTQAVFARAY